jgi:hypothetical protein
MTQRPGFFNSSFAWRPVLRVGLLAGCGSDGMGPPVPAIASLAADATLPR